MGERSSTKLTGLSTASCQRTFPVIADNAKSWTTAKSKHNLYAKEEKDVAYSSHKKQQQFVQSISILCTVHAWNYHGWIGCTNVDSIILVQRRWWQDGRLPQLWNFPTETNCRSQKWLGRTDDRKPAVHNSQLLHISSHNFIHTSSHTGMHMDTRWSYSLLLFGAVGLVKWFIPYGFQLTR